MKKHNDEFSVKELLNLFLPKIWIIAIVAVVFSLVMGVYSVFLKNETYTSSSKIMVVKTSSQISAGDIDLAAQLIDTYKILLMTDEFISYVVADMEQQVSYQEEWNVSKSYVKSSMSVSALSNDVFKVSVTTDDPAKSSVIAKSVYKMIEDMSSTILAYPEGAISARAIEKPSQYGVQDSKGTTKNVAIGFIGGAAVAMFGIFVYSLFDVIIRDKKRLEETFDVPVLGVIPSYLVEEDKR